MTEGEYAEWLPGSITAYAADHVRAGGIPAEGAEAWAARQHGELLPDGVATPDHHLLVAESDGRRVGMLWIHLQRNETGDSGNVTAFVYDVEVDESERGCGHGRAIMRASEDLARDLGALALRLHVFGANIVARRLYESLGYATTDVTMAKPLVAAPDAPPPGRLDATVRTWISPKAEKGVASEIEGKGLFAREPIRRDEVVAVKGGHLVDTDTLLGLPELLQQSDVQVTDELHIASLNEDEYDAGMLYLNHSCEPNVGFGGNIVLVAMRDINAGEELTTDYALFDDYDGTMTCHCGRPSCRKEIHGRDWRRPDLQRRYAGYFSWYLQQRISRS
jgi:GNAT superfamily N-acetyltransferase